jgi:CRP/FNR family transcriptional regulator, cyclic AMP receptor protein
LSVLRRRISKEALAGKLHRKSRDTMTVILDKAAFQDTLTSLPLVTYQPDETVIADGSRTGQLLILRTGAVVIVKEGTEIAEVAEPGAVFGELSVLLDQPHAADVRAVEISQFYVADAATLLAENPIAALYVATVLASRVNAANHALIQLKIQLQTGEPRNAIVGTVSKMQEVLSAFGWGALAMR